MHILQTNTECWLNAALVCLQFREMKRIRCEYVTTLGITAECWLKTVHVHFHFRGRHSTGRGLGYAYTLSYMISTG